MRFRIPLGPACQLCAWHPGGIDKAWALFVCFIIISLQPICAAPARAVQGQTGTAGRVEKKGVGTSRDHRRQERHGPPVQSMHCKWSGSGLVWSGLAWFFSLNFFFCFCCPLRRPQTRAGSDWGENNQSDTRSDMTLLTLQRFQSNDDFFSLSLPLLLRTDDPSACRDVVLSISEKRNTDKTLALTCAALYHEAVPLLIHNGNAGSKSTARRIKNRLRAGVFHRVVVVVWNAGFNRPPLPLPPSLPQVSPNPWVALVRPLGSWSWISVGTCFAQYRTSGRTLRFLLACVALLLRVPNRYPLAPA